MFHTIIPYLKKPGFSLFFTGLWATFFTVSMTFLVPNIIILTLLMQFMKKKKKKR